MEQETHTEKKNAKNQIDETREISQAQQQQQQKPDNGANKKRKHKEVFPFGNYRNYYGYRIDSDSEEDPRLKVMKKEWFQGKDCLDIGCNSGIMTIHIAKKFKCQSILGIDIDRNRVEDARWRLRNFLRQTADCSKTKKHKSELADKDNSSENQNSVFSNEETKENSRLKDLSQIVSFRTENFVQSKSHEANCYDTILCLSVSKWIHLNWGDDGLITLFSKVWKLLRPGGIFVLEPQPWKSYENNRRVSETASANYRKIIFRPNQFREILLDKIGFTSVEDLTSGLSGTKAGFDRPIFAFQK